jgi:hypothetical protein
LSFAGLAPEEIRRGLEILGTLAKAEMERESRNFEPSPAMV